MNKTKPIEPGCMAMIINSYAGNNGKIVSVTEYAGFFEIPHQDKSISCHNSWRHDPELKSWDNYYSNITPEYQLMRIDGFEEDDEIESYDELSLIH